MQSDARVPYIRIASVGFALLILPGLCAAALRPATAADLEAMRAAGIPNPQVGMLWDPASTDVGQSVGEAKQWLMQHTKLDKSRIACLNSEFAEKLKRFMEAVPGGPPNITSAYRTAPEQQQAINSGASRIKNICNGYHLYGLAADFNDNNRQQTAWMRANATQFGIKTIGAWDPNHFQDASGRHGQCGVCAAQGSSSVGSGGGIGGGGSAAPSSSLTQKLRDALGLATPPQNTSPQSQGGQSGSGQQPQQIFPPNPIDPFLNHLFDNTQGTTTPDNTSGITTATSTNETTNENQTGSTTAAWTPHQSLTQRLYELAHGTTSATGTPEMKFIPITFNVQDIARIVQNREQRQSEDGETEPHDILSLRPAQTFVAPDSSRADDLVISGNRLAQVLAELQTTASRVFFVLRPFGIRLAIEEAITGEVLSE